MLEGCVNWPKEYADFYQTQGLWQNKTLGSLLRQCAKDYGDKVAIKEAQRHLSYLALDSQADRLASGLMKLGIKPKDRIVVHLPNCLEFILVTFALLRLNALPIFALPSHRRNEIIHFCKVGKATTYIISEKNSGFDFQSLASEIQSEVETVKHVIVIGNSDRYVTLNDLYAEPQIFPEPDPSDVAFFLLSGGTTGLPKLIPRTHNDYSYNIKITSKIAMLSQQSIYLAALPMAHNFTLGCPGVLGTLSVGGTVICIDNPSPDEAFPIIQKEQVTVSALVPPMAILWMSAMDGLDYQLSSLELLQVGGSKLKAEHAKQLIAKLHPGKLQQSFGMSEGLLSQTRFDDSCELIINTQGKPVSKLDEIRIVNDHDENVEAEITGHLLVRGPYTIPGYYCAEEYNKKAFTAEGFFRTGDLAHLTTTNYLVIDGRNNDIINRGGEKIPADELENHLLFYPDIIDAVVLAIPDSLMGERTCAFILTKNKQINLGTLNHFLAKRGLADYKLLDKIKILDQFPKTAMGKVDKNTLRKSVVEKIL